MHVDAPEGGKPDGPASGSSGGAGSLSAEGKKKEKRGKGRSAAAYSRRTAEAVRGKDEERHEKVLISYTCSPGGKKEKGKERLEERRIRLYPFGT